MTLTRDCRHNRHPHSNARNSHPCVKSHIHAHSHPHSISPSIPLSLTLTLALNLIHSHPHSISPSLTLTLTLNLTLNFILTLPLTMRRVKLGKFRHKCQISQLFPVDHHRHSLATQARGGVISARSKQGICRAPCYFHSQIMVITKTRQKVEQGKRKKYPAPP